MRTISAPGAALLGGQWTLALLIELQLTVPVYLATCRDSIVWAGNTYVGGKQTAVSELKDAGGEIVGLRFGLSGVPSSMIAIALAEPIQGKLARLSLAMMTPTTQAITDVIELWTGTLDQMPITESGDFATVNVTAEHRGMTYSRPKGILYSDAEQQRLFVGDKSLEFLASQAQHQDVWPAASYFKQ